MRAAAIALTLATAAAAQPAPVTLGAFQQQAQEWLLAGRGVPPELPRLLAPLAPADRITAVEGARRFAAVAGTLHDPRPEVTYVEFPGARHELFNDLCRDEAYAVLGRWMRARLP